MEQAIISLINGNYEDPIANILHGENIFLPDKEQNKNNYFSHFYSTWYWSFLARA